MHIIAAKWVHPVAEEFIVSHVYESKLSADKNQFKLYLSYLLALRKVDRNELSRGSYPYTGFGRYLPQIERLTLFYRFSETFTIMLLQTNN